MITAQKDAIALENLINENPTIWEEIKNISYSAQEKAKNEALIAATELVKSKLNNPTIDPEIFARELMPVD
jgi:hypothetical protein